MVSCQVKYSYYRTHYRAHFIYPFGRPTTDVCNTCAELTTAITHEKNTAVRKKLDKKKVYKRKANLFYKRLRQRQERAQSDDSMEVLCFDFEQNFPVPHLTVNEVFYCRQMWVYNLYAFLVVKSKNRKCICGVNMKQKGG